MSKPLVHFSQLFWELPAVMQNSNHQHTKPDWTKELAKCGTTEIHTTETVVKLKLVFFNTVTNH